MMNVNIHKFPWSSCNQAPAIRPAGSVWTHGFCLLLMIILFARVRNNTLTLTHIQDSFIYSIIKVWISTKVDDPKRKRKNNGNITSQASGIMGKNKPVAMPSSANSWLPCYQADVDNNLTFLQCHITADLPKDIYLYAIMYTCHFLFRSQRAL